MKFSVIVPIYNAENYIKDCVQSVLNQTCKDFEIILINDGSVDRSGEICDEYARRYAEKIRVFHQQNQRQLLTRHNGIKAARGDYCIFLDADDSIVKEGLAILEKAIEKHNEPDMVIYSFYYDRMNGKVEKAKSLFEFETVFEGEGKKRLYQTFFTGTGLNNVWTKAVKRIVFDGEFPDYERYKTLCCSEDRLHSMGMVDHAKSVLYIDEPLYIYKLIPNSISRTFSVETLERFNVKVLYEEEISYIRKWNLEDPEYQQRLDASYIAQAWYVCDLYYDKARSKEAKSKILRYDWQKFIPEKVLAHYDVNPYLTKQQKQCWKWILDKEYKKLKKYLWKKKLYSKWKRMKKQIVGSGK